MAHELTVQELEKFSAEFNKNPENKVVARAAQRSGVLEASYNDRVQGQLTRVFSTELDTNNVTNQKHSGRCWLFATLNVLRHAFGKKYKAKDFTFSQAYNFFWDKIERANMFYNRILDSADMPLDSRQVKTDLDFAGSDGGQFQMAAIAVGEPPKTFDLEYRDDDKKYHLEKNLTPLEFLHKYMGDVDFDDYVVLTNAPDHDYNKLYGLPAEDNIEGSLRIKLLNVPMEYLSSAAIAQLKDGEAVWFGNDVLRQMDRKTGYLDTNLYKLDDLFGVDLKMSKADRLKTGVGQVSHAMTLVGVDEDNGEVRQWKVENSWGDKSGAKGFYVMNNEWFKDYVYEVVVHKKYLTENQKKLAEGPITDLPAWDSLA